MGRLDVVEYTLKSAAFEKAKKRIKFALVSDLHSRADTDITPVIDGLIAAAPDYILMSGDIFERLDGSSPEGKQAGFALMEKCSEICPVYYSVGNHENGGVRSWDKIKWAKIKSIPKFYEQSELDKIWQTGAVMLDDGYVLEDGIAFGGLSSGLINPERKPNTDWLDGFCSLECPKVLLCHHPEYYKKYLADKSIDLIVSGHAHGGQWRFFGRGVYAPGQGIFPKYTSGVHDGSFVISRGLKPSGHIPRIFNTPELVIINIE